MSTMSEFSLGNKGFHGKKMATFPQSSSPGGFFGSWADIRPISIAKLVYHHVNNFVFCRLRFCFDVSLNFTKPVQSKPDDIPSPGEASTVGVPFHGMDDHGMDDQNHVCYI